MQGASLQLAILGVLDSKGEMAAAEIYVAIYERYKTGPALAGIFVECEKLEDNGWIKSYKRFDPKSEKERTYFCITDEGRTRRVEMVQANNSEAGVGRPVGLPQPKPAQSRLNV